MESRKPIGRNKNLSKILLLYMLLFVGVFLYIIIHTLYIDIHADEYIAMALKQWTSDEVIEPTRGKIVDRNEIVLARSSPARNVIVDVSNIQADVERRRVADVLGKTLNMDSDTIYEKIDPSKKNSVVIARQITEEQHTALLQEYLRVVRFQSEARRYYPQNEMAAQLIGLTNLNGEGQTGIEFAYDKELKGKAGRLITESDRNGEAISLESEQKIPAQDGSDVILTIDVGLQSIVEEALQEFMSTSNAQQVQGILIDAKTGEILAEANLPAVDLNEPPRTDATELMTGLRNRTISDTFEPNTLMHTIMLGIVLETNAATLDETFICDGSWTVNGVTTKCKEKHGTQTIEQAYQNECNVVMSQVAEKIDLNQFYNYLIGFQFGKTTGIGLNSENKGSLIHKKYISEGEKGMIANGRHEKVTLLQISMAYAAIANKGSYMQSHVISKVKAYDGTVVVDNIPTELSKPITQSTADRLLKFMEAKSEKEEQKMYYVPGYTIGTVNDTNIQYTQDNKRSIRFTNVSMAPMNDPRYIVGISAIDADMGSDAFAVQAFGPAVSKIMNNALLNGNITPQYKQGEEALPIIAVPDVRGMLLNEAKEQLTQAGFESVANGTGIVSEQFPVAGTMVSQKSGIVLYMTGVDDSRVEQGAQTEIDQVEDMVVVPNVIGKTLFEALDIMDEYSLELESEGDPTTTIKAQNPYAGQEVARGATVTVSLDPLSFTVVSPTPIAIEPATSSEVATASTSD